MTSSSTTPSRDTVIPEAMVEAAAKAAYEWDPALGLDAAKRLATYCVAAALSVCEGREEWRATYQYVNRGVPLPWQSTRVERHESDLTSTKIERRLIFTSPAETEKGNNE